MNYSIFKKLAFHGSITLLFLTFVLSSNAQSIARQSISSYGSSHTHIGNSLFSQTVGQPYNTKLQAEVVVSQGFQQSKRLKIEKVIQIYPEELKIKVYPNPAKHSVFIQCNEIIKGGVVRVSDVPGRTIYEKQMPGSLIHQINCSSWNPGIYIIKILDNSNNQSISKLVISN